MIEPNDLSIIDLKKFHKATREKIECAKDCQHENKWVKALRPDHNPIKAEGRMVLRAIDEELDRRGYDVEKLFKDYKKI